VHKIINKTYLMLFIVALFPLIVIFLKNETRHTREKGA
jgi:hypothetical protein